VSTALYFTYDEPTTVYGDTAFACHHSVTNMVPPRSDTPLLTITLPAKLAVKVKKEKAVPVTSLSHTVGRLQSLYPNEKIRYPQHRELGGSKSGNGRFRLENNLLPLLGFDSRTF